MMITLYVELAIIVVLLLLVFILGSLIKPDLLNPWLRRCKGCGGAIFRRCIKCTPIDKL